MAGGNRIEGRARGGGPPAAAAGIEGRALLQLVLLLFVPLQLALLLLALLQLALLLFALRWMDASVMASRTAACP